MRRNRLKKWNLEDLSDAVVNSNNYSELMIDLGLVATSGNYRTVKKYIKELELDISHWRRATGKNQRKYSHDEIFCKNSNYSKSGLRQAVLRDSLISYLCAECGIGSTWNEKPLTLQLEHINGIHNDNRLFNLAFLCPNCHSQTETWCGRKLQGYIYPKQIKPLYQRIKIPKKRSTKIEWPNVIFLIVQLRQSNFLQVSKKLGVSDNAIRKHLASKGYDYKTLSKV